MLILTRKIGNASPLGTISECTWWVSGKAGRLGIEAPSDAMVHREEVYHRIAEENRLAARVALHSLDELTERKE